MVLGGKFYGCYIRGNSAWFSVCSSDLYWIVCSKASHSCNVFYTCFITAKVIRTHTIAVDISKKLGGASLHSFYFVELMQKYLYWKGKHSNCCEHVSKVFPWEFMAWWNKNEVKMNKMP